MFVALSPGSIWLMPSNRTKDPSVSHPCLSTVVLCRCPTTPPPKLVAPTTRNPMKIRLTDGRSLALCEAMALQPIYQRDFRRAHGDPVGKVVLQRGEERAHALLEFIRHVLCAVELQLEGILAHKRRMLCARSP